MYYYDSGWGRNPHFGDAFEELIIKYGVDLCLWGHVHNLLETCPVNNGTCVNDGEAPVHVVIGNGGMDLTKYPTAKSGIPTPSWVRYKLANFGWNEIVVDREKLREAYLNADVVLVPSRLESFGLVAAEALCVAALRVVWPTVAEAL